MPRTDIVKNTFGILGAGVDEVLEFTATKRQDVGAPRQRLWEAATAHFWVVVSHRRRWLQAAVWMDGLRCLMDQTMMEPESRSDVEDLLQCVACPGSDGREIPGACLV